MHFVTTLQLMDAKCNRNPALVIMGAYVYFDDNFFSRISNLHRVSTRI